VQEVLPDAAFWLKPVKTRARRAYPKVAVPIFVNSLDVVAADALAVSRIVL